MRKILLYALIVFVMVVGVLASPAPQIVPTAQAYLFACETGDLWTLLSCTLTELILGGFNYTWM